MTDDLEQMPTVTITIGGKPVRLAAFTAFPTMPCTCTCGVTIQPPGLLFASATGDVRCPPCVRKALR